MNKIYRVVWSTELGQWVVASEVAKGRKKKGTSAAITIAPVLAAMASFGFAPQALAGSGDIFGCNAGGSGQGFVNWSTTNGLVSYGCLPGAQYNYIGGGSIESKVNWVYNGGDPTYMVVNSGNTYAYDGIAPRSISMLARGGIFLQGQTSLSGNKIVNLAAGNAGTDAVNVDQLNAKFAQVSGGGNDANAVHYNTGTNSAKVTLAGTGGTTVANLKAGTQDADAVNLGQLKAAGINVDANGTPTNALVAYDSAAKAKVTLGGGANGTTIANVKDGDTSTGSKEAVNGGQLGLTNQNVTNLQNNYNTLSTTVGSLNDNALKWNGATYNAARQGANRTIDGLSNGTVTATSSDAINGSQLYGTANSVADVLGAGAGVNPDGTIKAPGYTIAGQTYHDVGSALGAIETDVAPKLKYIKFGYTTALDASASGTDSVAIGGASTATGTGALAIGNGARAMADNSVAIGVGSSTSSPNTLAVGSTSSKRRIVNVADGTGVSDAVTVGQLNTKIAEALSANGALKSEGNGLLKSATLQSSSLLGATASSVTPDKLIIAGPNGGATTPSDAIGDKAIAVGLNAQANADNAVAIGQTVSTLGERGVSIGQNVGVTGTAAVAVGNTVTAASDYAVSIGTDGTEVNTGATGAVAIGRAVSVGGTGTVGIGSNIIAAGRNAVVLGANSSDDGRADVLSVGSAGTISGTSNIKRQIVNVKAGTLDTDAVNLSQLKGVTTALGGGTSVNADGTIKAPAYVVDGKTYSNVGDAITAAAGIAGSVDALKWNAATGVYDAAHGSATTSRVANVKAGTADNDAVNVKQLKDAGLSLDPGGTPTNAFVTYDSAAKEKITLGGTNGTTIANVKDGNLATGSKEAVNGGQLYTVDQKATTAQTSITNVINGKAGLVQQSAAGAKLTVGKDTDGTQVDFTGTAGARQLRGMLKGTADTDGVNVSQLNGITNALGGGAAVAADGSITKPTYKVDGKDALGVDGAVTALDTRITNATAAMSDIAPKLKYIKFGYTNALDAAASGTDSLAIGGFAQATGDGALAIGAGSRATAKNSVAIGAGSSTSAENAFAVGSSTQKRRVVNVADATGISDAVTLGQLNTKIAEALSTSGALKSGGNGLLKSSTLLGATASSVTPDKLIIAGPNGDKTTASDAIGDKAIAIGLNSQANANNAVAIGQTVSTLGENGVSIGRNVGVTGVGAVAMGGMVTAASDYAVAIGTDGTEVNTGAAGAVAIGRTVSVGGEGTVGIGSNIIASGRNAVVLGANSSDDGRAEILSVGSAGTVPGTSVIKRQIVNVKAGTLDTDAVNLSQLKGVTGVLGGGASVDANGNVVKPQYDVGGNKYDTVGSALDAVKALAISGSALGITYDDDTKARATLAGTSGTLLDNVTAGAVSASSKQAINGSQLYGVSDSVAKALGGGSTVNADGTVKAPSYKVGDRDYGNVGDALSAIDAKATTGNTLGVAYDAADKGSITLAGAGGTTIGNLKAGKADDQAVNVAQLKGVTSAIGGGASVDPTTGAVTQPTFNVTNADGSRTPVHTVSDAVDKLDQRVVGVAGDVKTITNNFNTLSGDVLKWDGAKAAFSAAHGSQTENRIANVADATDAHDAINKSQFDKALQDLSTAADPMSVKYDDTDKTRITLGGKNASAPVTVSNVAAGTADNDAVNVKQLKDAGLIGPGGAVLDAVVYDANAQRASVTFGGANGTILNNVADGLVSKDSRQAINGGQIFQLKEQLSQSITNIDNRVTKIEQNGTGGGGADYIHANPVPASVEAPKPANAGDTAGIAVGYNAVASGDQASAMGDHAVAQAKDSVAVGNGSTVTEAATNSVALGNNSVADSANSVSIGSEGKERTISHVARGTADTDVATMGQVRETLDSANAYTDARMDDVWKDLGYEIKQVNRQANRGIAAASALVNVTPYVPGHTTVNAGMASYRGEAALGVGVSRWSDNGRVNLNAGVSAAKNDEPVFRVGIGYIF